MRGAGDRDRTGMASLEGLGLPARSWLVRAKSGACRAFRVPRREMAGRSSGSSVSLAQRPVECCGSRASVLPTPALRSESLLSSPSGTAHRAGHAGRWPTAWPLSCEMFGAGSSTGTALVRAVDRDGEGSADLPHARVGQPAEPFDEDRD